MQVRNLSSRSCCDITSVIKTTLGGILTHQLGIISFLISFRLHCRFLIFELGPGHDIEIMGQLVTLYWPPHKVYAHLPSDLYLEVCGKGQVVVCGGNLKKVRWLKIKKIQVLYAIMISNLLANRVQNFLYFLQWISKVQCMNGGPLHII